MEDRKPEVAAAGCFFVWFACWAVIVLIAVGVAIWAVIKLVTRFAG